MKHSPWHRHPHVRTGSELTAGERAADMMRNGMGSWPFVFAFCAAMIVWAVLNTVIIQHLLSGHPFDPYPYILLNLMLSTLAGLQGAILLIAAKRADQVAAELATHHYAETQDHGALLKANTDLTRQVHDLTAEVHRLVSQKTAPGRLLPQHCQRSAG